MADCCDMRGFLTFLVLKLISHSDMSGEDLRIELEKRKGQRPSPGTIYPVLKNLSEAGLIKEAPCPGREKKYAITPAGKKEVARATKQFCRIFYDFKDEF